MSLNKYDEWAKEIERVATFVSYDFPDVDKDDVVQELGVFVLATPRLKNPSEEGVTVVLQKAAKDICWKYRKEALNVTSQYTYRPSDVKRILDKQFDYEDWDNTFVPDDARSEDGAQYEVSADVSRGLDKLHAYHPDHYWLVVHWFRGQDHHPKRTPERDMMHEAIDYLTSIMNGY
jgi:hypothetical protein